MFLQDLLSGFYPHKHFQSPLRLSVFTSLGSVANCSSMAVTLGDVARWENLCSFSWTVLSSSSLTRPPSRFVSLDTLQTLLATLQCAFYTEKREGGANGHFSNVHKQVWQHSPYAEKLHRGKRSPGMCVLSEMASIQDITTRIVIYFLMVAEVLLDICCLSLQTEIFLSFFLIQWEMLL